VSFSGMTDAVLDVFERTGEIDRIGRDALCATQSVAVASCWPQAHVDSDETVCPLEPLAPQLAEVAPHPEGTFRDAAAHGLGLCRHIALLRFEGMMSLVSAPATITQFERWSRNRETVRAVIFVASHLSRLTAHQAGVLLELVRTVRSREYHVALCNVSDSVFEVLARTGVADALGIDNFYPTEIGALAGLWDTAHPTGGQAECPLEQVVPRVAQLSLHPDGSLRDSARHGLARCRRIAVVRFDGRLDYATLGLFERGIDAVITDNPELRWVVIAGHTLDRMDAIAAEGLAELVERIRASGRQVSISGLREEVAELLRRTGVEAKIGADHLFPTQERALSEIHDEAHRGSDEVACPLREVVPAEREAAAEG
jgi:anti-anti-sigma regulatory factor